MAEEERVPEEIKAMRQLILPWLNDPSGDLQQLIDWLQGYGLPWSGSDDEPHLWIVRGLPLGTGRLAARSKLASRLAMVLDRQPDTVVLGRHHQKLLYNLLMLAADLARPEELATPLCELYQRRTLGGVYHLGLDLRIPLRAALAENQLDRRLENDWFELLEARGRSWLIGTPFQGFDGVLLMPESPDRRHEPFVVAIGRALKHMANYLHELPDRRPKFQELIEAVRRTYGDPPSLNHDLILAADRDFWPEWAWSSLPSLADIKQVDDTTYVGLVWKPLAELIPARMNYNRVATLCDGKVFKLQMPENTAALLRQKLANRVEPARYRNDYFSTSSEYVIVQNVLSGIIDEHRDQDPDLASHLEQVSLQWTQRLLQLGNARDAVSNVVRGSGTAAASLC